MTIKRDQGIALLFVVVLAISFFAVLQFASFDSSYLLTGAAIGLPEEELGVDDPVEVELPVEETPVELPVEEPEEEPKEEAPGPEEPEEELPKDEEEPAPDDSDNNAPEPDVPDFNEDDTANGGPSNGGPSNGGPSNGGPSNGDGETNDTENPIENGPTHNLKPKQPNNQKQPKVDVPLEQLPGEGGIEGPTLLFTEIEIIEYTFLEDANKNKIGYALETAEDKARIYPDLVLEFFEFTDLTHDSIIMLDEHGAIQDTFDFIQTFTLDTTNANFKTSSYTKQAEGTALYKCTDFNTKCDTEWELISQLTFNQEYTLTFSHERTTYAELRPQKTPNIVGLAEEDLGTAGALNRTHTDGVVFYEEQNNPIPQYRTWDDTTDDFSAVANAQTAAGADLTWEIIHGSHERDEMIAGTIDKDNDVTIQIYDGGAGTWGNVVAVTNTTENSAYRSLDIAYEDISGDALIVFENGSTGNDNDVAYTIWNGTGYAITQSLDSTLVDTDFRWVELVPRQGTDQIMVLIHNDADDLYAILWNGTEFDTSLAITASTATTSSTEQHFAFAWESLSGQGLLFYGESDLTYRTYDPVGGFGGAENTITTGPVDALRSCSNPDGNEIGFIWQDSLNDVSARVWDGSAVLGSPPAEDATTEAAGTNNINVDCSWINSTTAIFGFIDNTALSVDYVSFTTANTWSTADLTSTSNTGDFAANDIGGMRFFEHPKSEEVMVVAQDIADTLNVILINGSEIFTIAASPLDALTEVLNGAQESAYFDWFRYDPNPNVTGIEPNGNAIGFSTEIPINVTIVDNILVDTVIANITLHNGTVDQVTLLNVSGNLTFYNGTYTTPSLSGTYTVTIFANDSSLHQNINDSESTTFSVYGNSVDVTWIIPTDGSNFSARSNNQTFNITVDSNAATDSIFNFDNSSGVDFNVSGVNSSGAWAISYNVSALAEGTHTVTVYANDTGPNLNDSETRTFTIDLTAPSTTSLTPSNGSNYSSTFFNQTFNVSVEDATATNVIYNFDNSSGAEFNVSGINSSGTWAMSYNISGLAEGTHLVTVYANDSVGNLDTTTTFTLFVDFSAPTVTFITPINNSNYSITSDNQTFNVTIADAGAEAVIFNFDNSSGIDFNVSGVNSSGNWAISYNISNVIEGTHLLTIYANDSTGNINTTETRTFVLDVTNPVTTLVAPGNGTNYSIASSNQTFNVTVADATTDSVIYNFENGSGTDFNVSGTNISGAWAISYNVSTLAEGTNIVTVYTNDSSGNLDQTKTFTLFVDYTSPAVSFLSPPAGSTFSGSSNNQTFNVSIEELSIETAIFEFDNSSGVDLNVSGVNSSGAWAISYNVSGLAEGVHVVTMYANDSSGNTNNSETLIFTLDNTPPNVTQLIPINSSTFNISNPIQIGASINDSTFIDAVFANVTYPNGTTELIVLSNQTGSPEVFNISYTIPLLNGTYNITFIANDTTNNRNASEITFFVAGDITPPAVAITAPTAGQNFEQNDNFTIAATITDQINVSVVFANITLPNTTVYERYYTDGDGDGIYNSTFNDTSETGVYTLLLIANDSSNNINNSQTVNFNVVDTGTPIVTLISPADNLYKTSSAVTFICNATDATALSNVSLYHNDSGSFTLNQTNTVLGTQNQTNFTVTLSDGSYLWNCLAADASDNQAYAGANFTVNVDTILPTPLNIINDPTLPLYNNGTATNISLNFTTAEYPLNVTFFLHNTTGSLINLSGNFTLASDADLPVNYTFPASLADGNYSLNFTLYDTAGNTNETNQGTISVDTIFPSSTQNVSTPSLPFYNNGSEENVSVNFSSSEYPINVTFKLYNSTGSLINTSGPITVNGDTNLPLNFTLPDTLIDGNFTLNMTLNDSAQNSNITELGTISVDGTSPAPGQITTDQTFPLVNNGTLTNVSLNFTSAQYPLNLTFFIYNSTGSIVNITGNITLTNATLLPQNFTLPTTLADGNYSLNFTLYDNAGNTNETNLGTVVFDTLGPAVTSLLPATDTQYATSTVVQISANITDITSISSVFANVTYPNSTVTQLTLILAVDEKYNASFTTPDLTGNYNVTFFTNDTSNNINASELTNFTVTDSTAPIITNVICGPKNITLNQTIECNSTVTDNIGVQNVSANVTLPNGSIQIQTLENITSVYNFTFQEADIVGEHTIQWVANDSGNNQATGSGSFNVSDVTAPLMTINGPANMSNTSATSISFNFTADDNYYPTLNCSLHFNGSVNTTAAASLDQISTNITITGFNDGSHIWNVSCSDNSTNTNISETRYFIVDTINPTFEVLNTSPKLENDLDPGVNVTIIANVTDNTTNLETVVFQYKLHNDTVHTNVTMDYNSVDLLYNTSFNATRNGTYSLRVFANDSAGNSEFSNYVNISVLLDKSWTRAPASFGTLTSASSVNLTLGNLTINNTGDHPLHFNITSDSNDTFFNDTINTSTNFTLNAGAVKVIAVNESAPAGGLETINITIAINDTDANVTIDYTAGKIVVAPGQPVIQSTFTTPNDPTKSVTQGDEAVAFTVKVENVGEGNATNVTSIISIPSDWNLTFGTLNHSIGEIDSGENEEHTIEVDIPTTATTGIFSVIANATGYNTSDTELGSIDLIFAGSVDVTVNSQTTTVGGASDTSGGGGGGAGGGHSVSAGGGGGASASAGGGGGPTKTVEVSKKIVHVTRGTTQEIPVTVANIDPNTTLTNIRLELDGFLAQYINITPAMIPSLEYLETDEFIMILTVPGYFAVDEYPLTVKILGDSILLLEDNVKKRVEEVHEFILKVEGTSANIVIPGLNATEVTIQQMAELGFPIEVLEKLLQEARDAIQNEDYTKAQKLLEKIDQLKQDAFAADEIIKAIQEGIAIAHEKLLDTPQTQEALQLAMIAFQRGDFSAALDRAKNAQLMILLETKGRVNVIWFVKTYWWAILTSLALALLIGILIYKKAHIIILDQRIKNLDKEENTIQNLIKEAQKNYLKHGTISEMQYNHYVDQYQQRLTKIRGLRIRLRNKRVALLKTKQELKNIRKEKEEVQRLLKRSQKAYLIKGKISRDEFMDSSTHHKERFAEIEQEETILEEKMAAQRNGKKSWWSRMFHREKKVAVKRSTKRVVRKVKSAKKQVKVQERRSQKSTKNLTKKVTKRIRK
jgi:hypothetical protein